MTMKKLLTESLEDYLEAIAELSSANGHAHTKEIAEKLNVKMPSVTSALRQLAQLGYIIYNTHYPVELTPAGEALAARVVARHKILKRFFNEILGIPADGASEAACHLEHLIDEETAAKFVLFSEAIENRQDASALRTYLSEAMELVADNASGNGRVLSSIRPGERLKIVRAGRNIPSGTGLPLAPGDRVSFEGMTLDKRRLRLKHASGTVELDTALAENIFVCAD